ncbi:phytanoyl-CoA dioxygenase [Paenibacillus pectinilyticus]|uniref:Phytanoyl-CoA dioxygenase n=2 Tax=Paenibacillus pectinilyticus TaxID=512399 RepID=A0A1C1A0L3_9BACL|nr:phytanoyl-CoA dioxygenase [Paenibacillus pectinilyticus]
MAVLGVTEHTLTEEQKKSLDEEGFVVFPDLLDETQLEVIRAKYEELMTKEGMNAGKEVHQEEGTRRLSDLVNKGECFDGIYTHPKLLAAVYHVLMREFKLSSLNARDAIPGAGLQALHADWGSREASEPFHVCNSIWLIDDFTRENGATRVVPGSHKLSGNPQQHGIDPREPHPQEVLLLAPAGSVGIFNSHVWHGGTLNRTTQTRRALHAYFTAREHKQQLDQAEYLRKKTFDRLSSAARYVLDV